MKTLKKTLFALSLLPVALTAAAQAGEFRHRDHRYHEGWSNHPHRVWQEGAAGVDGLPVHISGIGTFSGGITAVRFHGNGVYIAVAPGIALAERPVIAPKAKILTVSDNPEKDVCSMEHGVCVIRAR